jgi:phosphoenolpyruvate carboxylase
MGSWIGGDRDGNPNVTAATLEQRSPPGRDPRHYLDEVHKLGAELSLSACWSARRRAAGAGRRLARPVAAPRDEPYRRALIGIYARLAATRGAGGRRAVRAQAAVPPVARRRTPTEAFSPTRC